MSTVLRSLCVCAFLATSSSALSHADDKPGDSKSNERRTEWLWMNAEGGVEAANLTTFNAWVRRSASVRGFVSSSSRSVREDAWV